MKKITVPLANLILIACAAVCTLVSSFIMHLHANFDVTIFMLGFLVTSFGCSMFCLSTTYVKRVQLFFLGLLITSFGCLHMCLSASSDPEALIKFWPILCVLGGVYLIITCIYTYRRIRIVYAFPSILLIFLGILFLAFSSDLVKFSFNDSVGHWWFVFFLVAALLLVILYFYQRFPHNHFPYDKDTLDDSTDETDTVTGDIEG